MNSPARLHVIAAITSAELRSVVATRLESASEVACTTYCDSRAGLLVRLQTPGELADVVLCDVAETLTEQDLASLAGAECTPSRFIPLVLLVDGSDGDSAAGALASDAAEVLLRDPQAHYLQILPAMLVRAVKRRRPELDASVVSRLADLDRLSLVLEQLPASIWSTDRDLRFQLLDGGKWRAVKDQSPYQLGLTIEECLKDPDAVQLKMSRRALAGEPVDYLLPRKGAVSEVHVSPFLDRSGQIIGTVGVSINVTSSEAPREELRLRNAAIESATDGILITDATRPDYPIIYASPSFTQLTGYTSEESLGRNCRFLQGPDTDRNVVAQIRASIERAEAFHGRLLNYRKDGRTFWNELRIRPFRDDDGTVTRFVGSLSDVTQWRQAEEALKISQQRFADAFRSSPNALAISRIEDGLLYEINDQFEVLFGFSREESVGRTTMELNMFQDPLDRRRAWEVFQREGRIRNYEIPMLTASGELRQMLASSEPIDINGERSILTTLLDITEQRRAEKNAREHLSALAHMNRLVTASELASGLAHELNQPLASIRINAELAQASLAIDESSPPAARQSLATIVAQVQRAGSIIHMLRSLVRRGETRRSTVQLDQLVQNTLFLLEPAMREARVCLQTKFSDPAANVLCDPIQISQVLLNLFQNSLEALETIAVESRRITVEINIVAGKAVVSVSDTGIGLPTGGPEQLFGAFFTTKPNGLGLGLAISKSLVEAHGGQLSASQNSDGGATFALTLPLLDGV